MQRLSHSMLTRTSGTPNGYHHISSRLEGGGGGGGLGVGVGVGGGGGGEEEEADKNYVFHPVHMDHCPMDWPQEPGEGWQPIV